MTTAKEMFSIVMPAYNAAATIQDSILSVQQQTYTDWELLIIDDRSADDTPKIVQEMAKKDSRIKLHQLTKNSGVADARNVALNIAIGQYISFLDSDDCWTSNKLMLQNIAFQSGAKVVFGSYRRVYQDDTYQIVHAKERINSSTFKYHNPIGNLTGAFDRELGIIFQKRMRHEDYLMWYELVCRSNYAIGLQEILGDYRISPASLSANKLKAAKWHWDVLRQGMKLSHTESAIGFMGYVAKTLKVRASPRRAINKDS